MLQNVLDMIQARLTNSLVHFVIKRSKALYNSRGIDIEEYRNKKIILSNIILIVALEDYIDNVKSVLEKKYINDYNNLKRF